MRRLSSIDRVRAITGIGAGGAMALVMVGTALADSTVLVGWLPGMAPLFITASAGVAAWRADEAVATRSPLAWAWGNSWRSLGLAALGSGLILGVLMAQASIGTVPAPPPDIADAGVQVAVIVTLLSAPVPLLVGTVVHLAVAVAVRRAVRHRWRWFAS